MSSYKTSRLGKKPIHVLFEERHNDIFRWTSRNAKNIINKKMFARCIGTYQHRHNERKYYVSSFTADDAMKVGIQNFLL